MAMAVSMKNVVQACVQPLSPLSGGKAWRRVSVAVFVVLSGCAIAQAESLPYANDYAFGVDVSFVKQRVDRGQTFRDGDDEKNPLTIFRDHGYNWGRVHLCNAPVERLPQTLDYVIASGQQLKERDMRFLLDLMFSNGWANPTMQPMPSGWENLTHDERVTAVYTFCRDSIAALKDAGAMPDMVQVGNEIGNGFLWPAGRLYPLTDRDSEWENVGDYLKAGIKGIKEASGDVPVQIMVHVDHGGDIPLTRLFYDKMDEMDVDYDVIGLSFYPWSHGTLMDLKDNLRMTALRYNKPIIVVETGYHFQPSSYFRDVTPPFPETPEGQRQWLAAVNDIVLDVPNGLGRGVFWWEPMMGGRGYFDRQGNGLPILEAFHPYAYPLRRADGQNRLQ